MDFVAILQRTPREGSFFVGGLVGIMLVQKNPLSRGDFWKSFSR